MLNTVLYAVLPYVAFVLFLGVSIVRYRKEPFTFSSLSSQFLETRKLFWGSVPFHMGIVTLFLGHLLGFLFPREMMLWNMIPLRLFILESAALTAGLLTLAGLVVLIYRRIATPRLKVVTTYTDALVYVALLTSVVSGLWVALTLQWGSAWYTQAVVPYLWSIIALQPDIQPIVELPLVAQIHVVSAFVLFGLFSFTRLVHVLVTPVPYLWRPVQQVIWNRPRVKRSEESGS
jgi:nitrate reductase gamma subunit